MSGNTTHLALTTFRWVFDNFRPSRFWRIQGFHWAVTRLEDNIWTEHLASQLHSFVCYNTESSRSNLLFATALIEAHSLQLTYSSVLWLNCFWAYALSSISKVLHFTSFFPVLLLFAFKNNMRNFNRKDHNFLLWDRITCRKTTCCSRSKTQGYLTTLSLTTASSPSSPNHPNHHHHLSVAEPHNGVSEKVLKNNLSPLTRATKSTSSILFLYYFCRK